MRVLPTLAILAIPLLASARKHDSKPGIEIARQIRSIGELSAHLTDSVSHDDENNSMTLETEIETAVDDLNEYVVKKYKGLNKDDLHTITDASGLAVPHVVEALGALCVKAPHIKYERPEVVNMVGSAMADLNDKTLKVFDTLKKAKDAKKCPELDVSRETLSEAFDKVIAAYPVSDKATTDVY